MKASTGTSAMVVSLNSFRRRVQSLTFASVTVTSLSLTWDSVKEFKRIAQQLGVRRKFLTSFKCPHLEANNLESPRCGKLISFFCITLKLVSQRVAHRRADDAKAAKSFAIHHSFPAPSFHSYLIEN